MRAGLLTTGIILLVLGAIFYFIPSPANAEDDAQTLNNSSMGVQTTTYATAAEIYGLGNESQNSQDDDDVRVTEDDTQVARSDPFDAVYENTADDNADDNTTGTTTTRSTNTTTWGTNDDDMTTGTTTTASRTARDPAYEAVDYDGDGVATLFVVVTGDSIRPATTAEIDEISDMIGEDITAGRTTGTGTTTRNTVTTADDTEDESPGEDTSDDIGDNTTSRANTTNRTNMTNRTTTNTSAEDDGELFAGGLELQGEYETGEVVTTGADGSADGVGAANDVTGTRADPAVNNSTNATAGVTTPTTQGGDGTDEATLTATDVQQGAQETAAAAGGFLSSPLVRTLSLLAMILGAILTVLGLILPSRDETAAADRTARTTGAAGRRVEYERETTTVRQENREATDDRDKRR